MESHLTSKHSALVCDVKFFFSCFLLRFIDLFLSLLIYKNLYTNTLLSIIQMVHMVNGMINVDDIPEAPFDISNIPENRFDMDYSYQSISLNFYC